MFAALSRFAAFASRSLITSLASWTCRPLIAGCSILAVCAILERCKAGAGLRLQDINLFLGELQQR
ncbi:hypothetical protein BRDID11004_60030 [Bradyrhizobium diazoefficiens]|uniref:Uncharacterized protein n=1 Tax=Bradyrhizobium diazoefficiens TaxID=1355477 RepID=A0A810AM58_9BRAD|nr:hypothetical protein F07S3_29310 [Bradyrhizobium diazoefficiens]BCA10849.1 hypothetical protein BDHF08_26960 [Bradyrhizobium diazoefficiens]BCE63918.1 hypothetical protein XF6B_27170 [Bradyrhizobium diazoefficiens]